MNESKESSNITGSAGGVREAFAGLYEKHMPAVYQFILYRVGDVELAEDLTSSVFEKALANFRRYQSDRASFPTWLIFIARNSLIDYYRVRGRRKNVPLEAAGDIASADPLPEEKAVRREELQRLRLCLEGLSPREQEIISCKFGAEMTNRSIAAVLKLSDSNVGTTLYRAVQKLRDCFRKWQDG
ncbi:MAG: sigma-70 family RNA polymerase sigma factor [Chloroflexi bacterium]|nr:sigma-70 family RNA polymerase sigma factor [Chloroflexota bacterium]